MCRPFRPSYVFALLLPLYPAIIIALAANQHKGNISPCIPPTAVRANPKSAASTTSSASSHQIVNASDDTATTASDLLHPFNLLFLLALSIFIASVVKSLHSVPYTLHPRVDRAVTLFACGLLITFFVHFLIHASLDRHLSIKRFLQYFIAGGICAFITHAACTPIDVVKTRIQTTQGRYSGMVDAFSKIIADEGPSTLLKGLGATASGYFLHGAFKYSFYEVFKLLFSPFPLSAVKPTLTIAALSGFLAECIACVLLCPMEAIRIRSVSDPIFPTGVVSGLSVLLKVEGMHGCYKGLIAMLLKQVPYTVGQFVSFEFSVTFVKAILHATIGVQEGGFAAASISSVAGMLAGITAAIISHPGDTILSKINQEESDASALAQIARVAHNAGVSGLFLGLGPRLLQVSCMIGGQFLIYDSIKLWCGVVPASALPTHRDVAEMAAAAAAAAVALTAKSGAIAVSVSNKASSQ